MDPANGEDTDETGVALLRARLRATNNSGKREDNVAKLWAVGRKINDELQGSEMSVKGAAWMRMSRRESSHKVSRPKMGQRKALSGMGDRQGPRPWMNGGDPPEIQQDVPKLTPPLHLWVGPARLASARSHAVLLLAAYL